MQADKHLLQQFEFTQTGATIHDDRGLVAKYKGAVDMATLYTEQGMNTKAIKWIEAAFEMERQIRSMVITRKGRV